VDAAMSLKWLMRRSRPDFDYAKGAIAGRLKGIDTKETYSGSERA